MQKLDLVIEWLINKEKSSVVAFVSDMFTRLNAWLGWLNS